MLLVVIATELVVCNDTVQKGTQAFYKPSGYMYNANKLQVCVRNTKTAITIRRIIA